MSKLAINDGPKVRTKPFPSWPIWDETDCAALVEVCNSGQWWSLGGSKVQRFAQDFARFHDCKYGVCVPSGTVALLIALQAAGVGPGDEVIVTPYTFIASASSIIDAGAQPVFVDIDPDTYNIDPLKIEAAITDRTKAIMPVHIGGRPCDMDGIAGIARKHGLGIIEDCAQAHAAEWCGRKVGSFGDAGAFSFQASKNLTCGDGGIVVSNDDQIGDTAWSIHNVGRAPGGKWYEHPMLGSNYRMTEFQGAILLSQMKRLPEQTARRNENARYLTERLTQMDGIRALKQDDRITTHAYHLYVMCYQAEASSGVPKETFIRAMQAEGIPCAPGYVPLYRSGALADRYPGMRLEVAERVWEKEAVWLTQNVLLGERSDMDDIADAVEKVLENASEIRRT